MGTLSISWDEIRSGVWEFGETCYLRTYGLLPCVAADKMHIILWTNLRYSILAVVL